MNTDISRNFEKSRTVIHWYTDSTAQISIPYYQKYIACKKDCYDANKNSLKYTANFPSKNRVKKKHPQKSAYVNNYKKMK